jgi:hypothetical protein
VERAATQNCWTVRQQMEWEALDALRMEGVDQASSKCRKLSIGNVDWCPTATQLRVIVLFWCLCCNRAQGNTPVSCSHHRGVQKKARLENNIVPTTIIGFVTQYKEAKWE